MPMTLNLRLGSTINSSAVRALLSLRRPLIIFGDYEQRLAHATRLHALPEDSNIRDLQTKGTEARLRRRREPNHGGGAGNSGPGTRIARTRGSRLSADEIVEPQTSHENQRRLGVGFPPLPAVTGAAGFPGAAFQRLIVRSPVDQR